MKKNAKIWFLLVAMVATAIAPITATADVPAAVTYLLAQTQSPWTTMALAAAGQNGLATDHLKTVAGTLATDYAKTILALAAVGQNPAAFGNIDYVAKLKTFANNGQIGDAALINDDMWAVLALASVKDIAGQEFSDAKNFISSHQNADGGWSYSTSGISDTNDTAAAIMVLVEAGVGVGDSKITNAVDYLKTAQNADGGFGYGAGDLSDSGSDAWVIAALNKIGQDPAAWVKNNNTPVSHLQSLQDADGGFWWQAAGTAGNNKAMTAFAVIALSGKSYPIGYYQNSNLPVAGTYHLRIEGQTGMLCDTTIAAVTALEIVQNAANTCGYAYTITDSAFGRYLSAINNEAGAGMSGWLYFVNNISPSVGAADYALKAGDDVLWYYGDWGWNPARVTLDKSSIDINETAIAAVEYFNGTSWLPLANASVIVGTETKTAGADGKLQITPTANGVYQIYANAAGYVRSAKVTLSVGAATSQNVGLSVEVDQSGGIIAGQSIGLTITPDQLDFGKLKPGQSGSQNITITNSGTTNLVLGGSVAGDSVFINGITLDNGDWQTFTGAVSAGQNKITAVKLAIPVGYLGAGVKNGELIIWANAQ